MEELEALLETGAVAAVEVAASALAERGETAPPCPNCSNPLIGPFCAVCGQPRNTHRRSLGHLVHEFVKDIVSFDSRILRTTRALLLRPGELPKAFREGRTQPYVPAVRLYLFVTLLFFLFLSMSGLALIQFSLNAQAAVYSHDAAGKVYKTVNGTRTLIPEFKSDAAGKVVDDDMTVMSGIEADGKSVNYSVGSAATFFQPARRTAEHNAVVDAALNKAKVVESVKGKKRKWIERVIFGTLGKLRDDPAALNGSLTTWIPRILFVLLPLFAMLLAVFYRRQCRDYLYVDHLVFSLTMHSFAFVVLIVAAMLAQVMSGGWVAWIAWLVLSLYLLLSLKFFYGQSWIRTGVKFVGISVVYALFFLGPALAFAVIASVVWA